MFFPFANGLACAEMKIYHIPNVVLTRPLYNFARHQNMPRRSKIAHRLLRLEFLELRQMLSGTTLAAAGTEATTETTTANTSVASLTISYTETVGSQPTGSLSGKIVYTSGGHGYTADNLGDGSWGFQRPYLYDMIEDLGNQDQMTMYVDYLFRAGATVVPLRPVGHQTNEVVLDNDDSEVEWIGSWSNSSSSVYYGSPGDVPYCYANTSSTETAIARYRPNIPESGNYPVYTWASAGSNRVTNQLYTIHHAGGDTQVTINHQAVGGGYVYLGTYYFEAGTDGYVDISNQSNESGVVIADSIRFGNGMSDIDRGGGVSGRSREDEPALYWIMAQVGQGTPESEWRQYSSDGTATIRAPIMWAEHMNREEALDATDRVYLGFHTNASSGTARGAMALYNDGSGGNTATPNQYAWAKMVSDELTLDLQAIGSPPLESDWGTAIRAPYGSSYGEIDNRVINSEFDATIIEVAFHDNQTDAQLLLDADVRDYAARACYQATVEYFNTFDTGSSATLLPDPVTNVTAIGNDDGTITVQWDAPVVNSIGGDAPTGYVIYKSTDGTGFDGGTYISALAGTSVTFNNLPDSDGVYYFRVAARNSGGESKLSAVVVAAPSGTSGDRILIVNGFDRQDRFLDSKDPYGSGTVSRVRPDYSNSYTYATQVGQALESSAGKVAVSSVQNEAVISGEVNLSDYDMVVWILGEESTADDTFNATEQAKVSAYLASGGNLFVSGAEIGYELTGTSFYSDVLHATYIRDDAATYTAQGTTSGIFAGINLTFDDGSMFYDTNYPDVIAPGSGAQAAMSYVGGTGGTAAIQYDGTGSQGSVVMLGFPFETITSSTIRESMMTRVLDFFEVGTTPANEAPVACADYYSVHLSDILDVAVPGVLINDTDPERDSLTATLVSSPSHGTLNLSNTGAFTYDPDSLYRGLDTFTYKASDGSNLSNEVTVTILVYNNAPTVAGDTYTLDRVPIFAADTTTGIMSNDVDVDGDFFCVFVQDNVEHGTLTLNTNGSFIYVPDIGFSGTDQFTYYATDGYDTSTIATVTFQVQSYITPGDANMDGMVDGSDVTILAGNWQTLTGATWAMGDFNHDGRVDGSDVTILASNWQAGVNTTTVQTGTTVENTEAITDDTENESSVTRLDQQQAAMLAPASYTSIQGPQPQENQPRRRALKFTLHDAVLADLPE